MYKTLSRSLAVVAVIIIAFATNGYSQPACPTGGCLDTTFNPGGGGMLISTVPGSSSSSPLFPVVTQQDGKIVILFQANNPQGTIRNAITRLNADGTTDTTFGQSGWLYIPWNAPNGISANTLAIQNVTNASGVIEERFVIAGGEMCGRSNCLRAERYLNDGTLDTTFGVNGITSINTGWYPYKIAVGVDQKILLAGAANPLVRLNPNGTADVTFGANGISPTKSGIVVQSLYALAGGSFLAAGSYKAPRAKSSDMAVGRFNPDGSLDGLFGTAGIASVDFAGLDDHAMAVNVDSAGRIVAAGQGNFGTSRVPDPDAALVRFSTSGRLDTTFGSGGKTTLRIGSRQDFFRTVSFQSDGKIVLAGEGRDMAKVYNNADALVARYDPNGFLDPSFGVGGWFLKDMFGTYESPGATVQMDPACQCEKILVMDAVTVPDTGGYEMVMMGLME
ncbi:MAG: hypothetical protein ABIP78_03170 [Pyrinomonadaceae bacterium]